MIIPVVVDITLHYFLWFIETNEDIDLQLTTDKGLISLNNISDGLAGELYAKDGWMDQFSTERVGTNLLI